MSIQRDAIPFGPGKIVFGSSTFYSAGDIDVTVITEFADVNPDQYGQGVKTILDRTIEVELTPQSIWALLANVFPDSHIAPTALRSRLIGANPTQLTIHGEDSSLLTIFCPALTDLPQLMLGVDKGEFGKMKFTGVVTNGKDIGDASALYTYAATGGTYGTPGAPDYLAAAEWDMDWNSSALAGTLLESVSINPDFKAEPVKAGPRTVDFRHGGIQFSASVVAAVDEADVSGLHNDGSLGTFGQRNTAVGGDLVLTSALGHTFSLLGAAIEKNAQRYGMKDQRARAIDFRTSVLTGARISWTTPS